MKASREVKVRVRGDGLERDEIDYRISVEPGDLKDPSETIADFLKRLGYPLALGVIVRASQRLAATMAAADRASVVR